MVLVSPRLMRPALRVPARGGDRGPSGLRRRARGHRRAGGAAPQRQALPAAAGGQSRPPPAGARAAPGRPAVIALEVADLAVIASRTLGLDTDRVLDLLDVAAAERALDRARPGSDPADPAGQAAVLLHALVRERPLRDGNQQVALAAMLQFLAVNGWDVDSDPPGPVADMVTRLAAGTAGTTAVADMLAPRLRPRPELPLIGRIKEATLRTRRKGMFMQFTDRARRVVVLAENEARGLGHGFTGTEHLLLGLLAEGEGVAAQALASLGAGYDQARERALSLLAGVGEQADPRTRLVRLAVPRDLADATDQL